MKIVKHTTNLSLLFLFGMLVITPFAFSRITYNKNVLGEQAQKEYHKRTLGNSDNLLIRNLSNLDNKERDAISLILDYTHGSFYTLYEITNLTSETESFNIHPDNTVIGNMTGKRLSLQSDKTPDIILFYDDNRSLGNPGMEFKLKPNEKILISLSVENETPTTEKTPLSFDLLFEKW